MRIGALLLVSCFLLVGCGSEPLRSWPEIRGRVLDAETEEPIEGVIVNMYTYGNLWAVVDSQSVCYRVETATTDKRGRFVIPSWSEGLKFSAARLKHRSERVFKAGYVESKKTYKMQSYRSGVWYQEKFRGTQREWFEYLKQSAMSTICSGASTTLQETLPMLNAILREVERLQDSPEKENLAEWLKYDIGDRRERVK